MSASLTTGREALLEGRAVDAASIFAALVQADPRGYEARYWLSSALSLLGDAEGANDALADARTLHALAAVRAAGVDLERLRAEPAYANTIGARAYSQSLPAIASVVWGMGLSTGQFDAQNLVNYGLSLQHQGRVEEAATVFRAAAEHFPSPQVDQFAIYPQLFRQDGEARHAAEARAWGERYAPSAPSPRHDNKALVGRKLRIGYMAPAFATTQLRQFIAPLLENHDRRKVSVTLYPAAADTEAGWPGWIEIHPLGNLSDDEAAALIRRDGIDVLADCWGHTAGSRLPVFARKPAPVQIAWLNFVQTTGLAEIDYIPHAGTGVRPYESPGFVERIWPIGPVFTAFRPSPGRLDPVATPALAAEHVTLGSFNHPAKLSDPTLDAWAAIMRQAPNARLLLKYSYFADPVLQRATQARFAARGVAPERIAFAGRSDGEAYFQAFREVDLMLDAWPAPGSTTTLDALSHGVPVLVMAGPTLGGAYSRSMLAACGLPELIAEDPDAFVDRALALIADPGALDAMRARVRPGFDHGACCDEAAFARRVEQAFREMFDLWSDQARAERRAS